MGNACRDSFSQIENRSKDRYIVDIQSKSHPETSASVLGPGGTRVQCRMYYVIWSGDKLELCVFMVR